jgi:AsmA protein
MKKLITTFAILVVVIVAGMSALVLLVNPNDFKRYMVQQVEKRSGYQLKLSGPLRWHVWPKLSILSGPMSLTAPGADQPAVTADNMRLDVELLPLISHQLRINQVLITHAVIQATPAAQARNKTDAPIAPDSSGGHRQNQGHWTLDIARVNIANSLLVWQDPQGEQLNFRKLNLTLRQDEPRAGRYQLSTEVTRNQQTLSVSLQGQMDARAYPQKLLFSVDQGDYQLQGVSLPEQGITGNMSFTADWSPLNTAFSLSNFKLHANDSDFSGKASGMLAPHLQLSLDLHAGNANFDQLFTHKTVSTPSLQTEGQPTDQTLRTRARTPVVVEQNNRVFPDWLSSSQISSAITADKATWHGVALDKLVFTAQNEFGVMKLSQLDGKLGAGQFAIKGQIDFRPEIASVQLETDLQRMPLAVVMPLLQLPPVLHGEVSLQGAFKGEGLQGKDMLTKWQGNSAIELLGLDIPQMNVQQMVIDAVTRASERVKSDPTLHPVAPDMRGSFTLQVGAKYLIVSTRKTKKKTTLHVH